LSASQSGLAAWMMEFRVVTLVYVRLGASDAAAGARLHGMFEVVTQAAEAFEIEIFGVVAAGLCTERGRQSLRGGEFRRL
jgi:hypothetical protein